MSINHLLLTKELDIVAKSLDVTTFEATTIDTTKLTVGPYNATPFNSIQVSPATVTLQYTPFGGGAATEQARNTRYYITKQQDFINVIGFAEWTFAPNTVSSDQTFTVLIDVPHPQVDPAFANPVDQVVTGMPQIVSSNNDAGIRITANVDDFKPIIVTASAFESTLSQDIASGVFVTANEYGLGVYFNYSILCKTI